VKIAFQKSFADIVKKDIQATFTEVVVVPIVIEGKTAAAFIGIGPSTPNPATGQQLTDIAKSLMADRCPECNEFVNCQCARNQ
jgi:hypothetical protein